MRRQSRQRNGHGGLRKPNLLLQNYTGEGGSESPAEAPEVQVTQMKAFRNHPLCTDPSSFLLFCRVSVASHFNHGFICSLIISPKPSVSHIFESERLKGKVAHLIRFFCLCLVILRCPFFCPPGSPFYRKGGGGGGGGRCQPRTFRVKIRTNSQQNISARCKPRSCRILGVCLNVSRIFNDTTGKQGRRPSKAGRCLAVLHHHSNYSEQTQV